MCLIVIFDDFIIIVLVLVVVGINVLSVACNALVMELMDWWHELCLQDITRSSEHLKHR